MQQRPRGANIGLFLLISQILHIGLTNIPPVTLVTLAVNVYLFLRPLEQLQNVCISVQEGYYEGDWHRLYLSPFHHADDLHLYFNMASLLWKGMKLERRLGSVLFGYIIMLFSLLIGVVYMILELALAEVLNNAMYIRSCAVGFSGVLFALKVLNNHYHPGGSSNIMGIPVSNKYACWLELVAIHLLSPRASFAGHLAGILVGLMYTTGPLKLIMEALTGNSSYPSHTYYQPSDYDTFTGGLNEAEQFQRAVSNSLIDRGDTTYYQSRNYDTYSGGRTEDEEFQRALRNSLNDRGGSGTQYNSNERRPYGFWLPPNELSHEELRLRRLNRFERW